MKNLDLGAYGVSEMNKQEMVETDGGIVPLIILGAVISKKTAATIAACIVAGGVFGAGVYVGYTQAAKANE